MDTGPLRGILRFTGDLTPEQETAMREHLRDRLGGPVVITTSPDVEYHPLPRRGTDWQAPNAQDVFTLRSVMAAHQAARQHLAHLHRQREARMVTEAEADDPAQLREAADAERWHRDLVAAEAREAEVLEELAEAHFRATGRPLAPAPPAAPVPPHAYGPGSLPPVQRPADPAVSAERELTDARLAESAARDRLAEVVAAPARLHAVRARKLRRQGATATGLAVVGALTTITGFPAIVPVVAFSLMVVVILLGLVGIGEVQRQITTAREQRPDADADHDAALRRLVAAEAGALVAGVAVTPSTLDADVERAAGRPVPLSW